MRQHSHFRAFRKSFRLSTDRVMSRLTMGTRQSITGSMKLFKPSVTRARISGGIDEANRMESGLRHRSILLANTATQDKCILRQAVANVLPLRSASPIRMPEKTSKAHADFNIQRESTRHQEGTAKTRSRRVRKSRAMDSHCESARTSTHQRARLTLVRRGMQMFGDAASRGLLMNDWLLHQKTREHCGGCFVEPLFEEGINFLF